jgi:hypothetical protein
MSKSSKSVPVWVNAGEKAVVFNRVDGKEWDVPLFVNVPNGVREGIVTKLAKGADGKATRNITWEMPVALITRGTSKKDGRPYMAISISTDASDTKSVFLGDWLSQLVVTSRGAVQPVVKSILDAWLADDASDETNTDPF